MVLYSLSTSKFLKRDGEDHRSFTDGFPPFDYIIASDCVYLEDAFNPLLKTLCRLSHEQQTITFLASVKRRKADKKFFVKARKYFKMDQVSSDLIKPPVMTFQMKKVKEFS